MQSDNDVYMLRPDYPGDLAAYLRWIKEHPDEHAAAFREWAYRRRLRRFEVEDSDDYPARSYEGLLDDLDDANTALQRMTEWRDRWKRVATMLWRASSPSSRMR